MKTDWEELKTETWGQGPGDMRRLDHIGQERQRQGLVPGSGPPGPGLRHLAACSFSGSLACPWAPTLVNVIAAKVGPIRVVGQEVSQEGGEVVAMPQHQVGAQHVLVHEAQVEVVAKRVHMHQVPHLVTLLREQHGQLGSSGGDLVRKRWQAARPSHSLLLPGKPQLKIHPVAVGPSARNASVRSPPHYIMQCCNSVYMN